MRLRKLLAEVHDAEPLLSSVAWLHVFVLLISVISIPYDPREVLGLNPWIKPIKFAISIDLDVSRLRQQLEAACQGLPDCAAEELVEDVRRQFYNGIRPEEIGRTLVLAARARHGLHARRSSRRGPREVGRGRQGPSEEHARRLGVVPRAVR